MSSTDNTVDIMERIRRRKAELGEAKENLTLPISDDSTHTEKPVKDSIHGNNKEIFAKIAADHDNYESSPTKMIDKETLMKGRSPRVSYGQGKCHSLTPPNKNVPPLSILPGNSPNGNSHPHINARRIQFALPVSATANYTIDSSMSTINESTILAGSGFNSSNISPSNQTLDDASTVIGTYNADQEASLQYGAHTFMKKKVASTSHSSSSLNLSSPKPFVSGASSSSFSPVQFNPVSTSSPLKVVPTLTESGVHKKVDYEMHKSVPSKMEACFAASAHDAALSPIRAVALENANAKHIAKELEAIISTQGTNIPTPRSCSTAGLKEPAKPTQDVPLRTLYRGTLGTPVVLGTPASLVTKPDIRSTNLQNLRDRWEFSSKTGTPIHPDKTGDKLVDDARILQQTAIPTKHSKLNDLTAGMLTPTVRKNECSISPELRYPVMKRCISTESTDMQSTLDTTDIRNNESNPPDGNISKLFDFLSESPVSHQDSTSDLHFSSVTSVEPQVYRVAESYVVEESHLPDDVHFESSNKRTGDCAVNLPYSLSFYRKRGRMHNASETDTEVINLNKFETSIREDVNEEEEEEKQCDRKERLTMQCKVQEAVISQVKLALRHCKSQEPFRGSREEVEAHRSLLLATETKRALEVELDKYKQCGKNRVVGPLGSITISEVNVYIQKEFLRSFQQFGSNSGMTCYFMLVLKQGEHVTASSIISIDDVTKDCLEFGTRSERDQLLLSLENVASDFQCMIEVYKLLAPREQFSHEEKYRIKGSTRGKATPTNMPPSRLDAIDYAFQSVGFFTIDIDTPIRQKRHHFNFADHPLDNEKGLVIKMKKRAVGQTDVGYQNFLSMYQRTKEGLGSWNRYWCVMESGEMKFWKSPEDQANNKNWLVLLDLHTCVAENGEGARPVEETCFLHPFHIDVWVPRDDVLDETMRSTCSKPSQNVDKLRVMLAAGTKAELQNWLQIVNKTVRHISMWSPKH